MCTGIYLFTFHLGIIIVDLLSMSFLLMQGKIQRMEEGSKWCLPTFNCDGMMGSNQTSLNSSKWTYAYINYYPCYFNSVGFTGTSRYIYKKICCDARPIMFKWQASCKGHPHRQSVLLASTKSCIPCRRGKYKANSLTMQAARSS